MNPKEHTMRQLELLLTAAGYEVRMLQSWCFVTDLAVFDFWSDETITVGAQGKSKTMYLGDVLPYLEEFYRDQKAS
jgi:hypothetical protein